MDEINRLWGAYDKYKETAEQHEFVHLLILDSLLIPKYKDLKDNYTEEHAEIFKRAMRMVLASLGALPDEQEAR